MKLDVFINSPYQSNEYDAIRFSTTIAQLKEKMLYLYNDKCRALERLKELEDEFIEDSEMCVDGDRDGADYYNKKASLIKKTINSMQK